MMFWLIPMQQFLVVTKKLIPYSVKRPDYTKLYPHTCINIVNDQLYIYICIMK